MQLQPNAVLHEQGAAIDRIYFPLSGMISLLAHALQQAGLIRYTRGHIKILNRDGLEDCACECYSVIRTEPDKMMGAA